MEGPFPTSMRYMGPFGDTRNYDTRLGPREIAEDRRAADRRMLRALAAILLAHQGTTADAILVFLLKTP